jgi:hypothetical protein
LPLAERHLMFPPHIVRAINLIFTGPCLKE